MSAPLDPLGTLLHVALCSRCLECTPTGSLAHWLPVAPRLGGTVNLREERESSQRICSCFLPCKVILGWFCSLMQAVTLLKVICCAWQIFYYMHYFIYSYTYMYVVPQYFPTHTNWPSFTANDIRIMKSVVFSDIHDHLWYLLYFLFAFMNYMQVAKEPK